MNIKIQQSKLSTITRVKFHSSIRCLFIPLVCFLFWRNALAQIISQGLYVLNRSDYTWKIELALVDIFLIVNMKSITVLVKGLWFSFMIYFIFLMMTVPLLWRDTVTTGTLRKESIYLGLAYSFKGLVNYHHGR